VRAVILGAGGQLAYDLERVMQDWDLVLHRHADLDVCDHARARQVLTQSAPEVVINTTAFHRVDDCEAQVEKAFQVNAVAVRNLAQVCRDLDCTLVHMSTDYVFGGEKRTPYTEGDLPDPLSTYGASKLAGEYFVRHICPKHFVVRTSGLYGVAGSSGKGGNFVETMIRLASEGKSIRVVNDQVLSPTYTVDLAEKVVALLRTEAYGLYHIANAGECSWYQFAAKIFELAGLHPILGPTTSAEYGSVARRPPYSALATDAMHASQFVRLSHWTEALQEYLGARDHGP